MKEIRLKYQFETAAQACRIKNEMDVLKKACQYDPEYNHLYDYILWLEEQLTLKTQ